jgi:hypothetical protein
MGIFVVLGTLVAVVVILLLVALILPERVDKKEDDFEISEEAEE